MNKYATDSIQENYLKKLHQRVGDNPTYTEALSEYGQEAILWTDIRNGRIRLDGPSLAKTICERRFEIENETKKASSTN